MIVCPLVIIMIWRAKQHAIMLTQPIGSSPRMIRDVQPVPIPLSIHFEVPILCIYATAVEVPQIHPQVVMMLIGQEEQVVISQPEFPIDITKSGSILMPVAVEVSRAVLAALEDKPATRGRFHVTVDRDGASSVQWSDVVDSTASVTFVIHLFTV